MRYPEASYVVGKLEGADYPKLHVSFNLTSPTDPDIAGSGSSRIDRLTFRLLQPHGGVADTAPADPAVYCGDDSCADDLAWGTWTGVAVGSSSPLASPLAEPSLDISNTNSLTANMQGIADARRRAAAVAAAAASAVAAAAAPADGRLLEHVRRRAERDVERPREQLGLRRRRRRRAVLGVRVGH